MAKVTFKGGNEQIFGNIGSMTWPVGPPGRQVDIVFPLNKPVEVTDRHILSKIRGMGEMSPFEVEDDEEPHGSGAKEKHGADDGEESDEKGTLKGSVGTRQRKITP